MNTSSLIKLVTDRFPTAVSTSHTYRGDETVILRREFLLDVVEPYGLIAGFSNGTGVRILVRLLDFMEELIAVLPRQLTVGDRVRN